MANLTNETINEIRNKTDIIEVISRYVSLTKRGKNYFGVCPFHDDHSPSMSVSPEKQIYTCFSCGATGNVFTFVSEYEHISFIDAVTLLGSKLGLNLTSPKYERKTNPDYEICNLANKFYQNNLNTQSGRNALNYLEVERQFDRETIKKFEIGLSTSKLPVTDYLLNKQFALDKLVALGISNNYSKDVFQNRIMFPLHDLSGNVVGFSGRIYNTKDNSKYLNTKETDIFKKTNLLYNYHRARDYLKKNDSIIVMEGFFDVIRASSIGIANCVATMGTAFTKSHANILRKITDKIILCFDGDSAGEEATVAAIKILEDIGVTPQIIRLEEKDPDEYILKRGATAFLAKIAKPLTVVEFKMSLLRSQKNLTNLNDISSYVDESLKELVKIKDDILVELTVKKLATEFNINYETLKNKYDNYKKNTISSTPPIPSSVFTNLKNNKKSNKYLLASHSLIYIMLKDSRTIPKLELRVTSLPEENLRILYNEIICFYHKYGNLEIADFITYISPNEPIYNLLKEILNINLETDYTNEELEDYIKLINEYNKNVQIEKLQQTLKKEIDPIKQAGILKEMMKIRGVKS